MSSTNNKLSVGHAYVSSRYSGAVRIPDMEFNGTIITPLPAYTPIKRVLCLGICWLPESQDCAKRIFIGCHIPFPKMNTN